MLAVFLGTIIVMLPLQIRCVFLQVVRSLRMRHRGTKTARHLLLNLDHAKIIFSLIVRKRDDWIVYKA